MLKLSRIHFHECGYLDSYKERITLDLRDPRDGRLHDAVLSIENGGGKTGLLSQFFSCFDTRLDRYLRTLIRKHERFEQDFGEHPGVIATEWVLPKSSAPQMRGDPLLLVTAQVVRRLHRAGKDELERHFLLFRSGPAYGFDEFVASLGGGEVPRMSREEVPAWLHRLRAEIKPALFWDGISQDQWHVRLEEHGIDVELLRRQVDFNREEGGIDRFLDIKDERDFLVKFLRLTLNAEAIESTRSLLLTSIQRLGERQQLSERSEALRQLQAVFGSFVEAAAARETALASLAANRAQAAGLSQALLIRRRELEQGEQEAKARIETLAEQIAALAAEQESVRAGLAARSHERLRRQSVACEKAFEDGRAAVTAARNEHQLWQAALAKREIDILAAEIDALQQQIEASERDLAEPRLLARSLGGQLHRALGALLRSLEASLQGVAREQQALETQEREQKALARQLEAAVVDREKQQSLAQHAIELHDRKRTQLEAQRFGEHLLLQAGETAADASARWQRLHEDWSAMAAALAQENAEAHERANEYEEQSRDAHERAVELAAQQQQDQRRLAQAENERQRLSQHPALIRACDETRIEPESAEVRRLVTERCTRLAQKLREAERALEQADAAGEAIRRSGLSHVDADAWRVADALHAAGVRDAQPYARWLADTLQNPDALRRFAAADPARFSGVYVPLAAYLEKAELLDTARLALLRSVQVSVGTHEASTSAQCVTLAVADASAYDLQAAATRLQTLDRERGQAQQDIAGLEQEASELREAEAALLRHLDEWGEGRLALLQRALRDREQAMARERQRKEEAAQQARNLRAQIGQRAEKISQLVREAADAVHHRKQLADFQAEHAGPLASRRKALIDTQAALSALREQQDALRTALERTQAAVSELGQRRQQLAAQRGALAEEQAKITELDMEAPASDEPTEQLRAAYRTAFDALRSAEQGRLDGPRAKLDEQRRQLSPKRIRYTQNFQELAQLDVQLRAGEPALERRQQAAEEAVGTAQQEVGRLQSEAARAHKLADESQRKLPQAARERLAALASEPDAELQSQATAAQQRLIDLDHQREKAISAQQQAHEAAAQARSGLDQLGDQLEVLRPWAEGVLPALVKASADLETLKHDIRQRARACTAAQNQADACKERAREHLDAVRQCLRQPPIATLEPTIAAALAANELEAACDDAPRLALQLDERLATVIDDLRELDADHGRCLDKLVELTKQAEHQLRSAARRGTVPESVPRFGGKPVLKVNPIWERVDTKLRRARLDLYVADLARAQRVPEEAPQLAAECLMHLATSLFTDRGEGVLGLRILKTNAEGELRHEPIHRLGSSGGERLTSALLLYLVVAHLRAETRADGNAGSGGVLLLDNPFGKVNKPAFLQMQRALARAMDVQLVYTTGILDLNSLAEFELVIRMRRGKKRGGRSLIEAVRLIDGVAV